MAAMAHTIYWVIKGIYSAVVLSNGCCVVLYDERTVNVQSVTAASRAR